MKDSIMAQSERRGAIVGSTSSTPLEGSTAAVGSTKVSSTAGKALEARAVVKASPRDLFDVPMLGSTLFICACRYLRKVAHRGAMMWTNSKGGNLNNSKNLKILYMNIGKNNFWALLVLL